MVGPGMPPDTPADGVSSDSGVVVTDSEMTMSLSTTINLEIAVQARLSAPDTRYRIETDTVSRELSVETTTGVRSGLIACLLHGARI